jgi:hypothetical protein
MNIPGFTAEACFYKSSIYYKTKSTEIAGRGATIEAALIRQEQGPTCSGSCPEGQLLCTCSKMCGCCLRSCYCDVNGLVVCGQNPPRGGFNVPPVFSPGGVLGWTRG